MKLQGTVLIFFLGYGMSFVFVVEYARNENIL